MNDEPECMLPSYMTTTMMMMMMLVTEAKMRRRGLLRVVLHRIMVDGVGTGVVRAHGENVNWKSKRNTKNWYECERES